MRDKGHLFLKTEAQKQTVTLSTSPIRQALEDFLLSREAILISRPVFSRRSFSVTQSSADLQSVHAANSPADRLGEL